MKPNPKLNAFLSPYAPEIRSLTIALRNFITDLVPEANELIWDNYNAVAMAYSKSTQLKDAFCHIAVYANHVNFGFNRGAELTNHNLDLLGKGKLIRHLKLTQFNAFPTQEITPLIWQALGISEQINPQLIGELPSPQSKVMSISKKKIRPNSSS